MSPRFTDNGCSALRGEVITLKKCVAYNPACILTDWYHTGIRKKIYNRQMVVERILGKNVL